MLDGSQGKRTRFTKDNAKAAQLKGAAAKKRKNEIVNLCVDCVRKILSSRMPMTDGAKSMFRTYGIEPSDKESAMLVSLLRAFTRITADRDIVGLEKFVKLGGIHPDQPRESSEEDNEITVVIKDA